MLHTKYQDYSPCCFRQEIFSLYAYIKYEPRGRPIFWPQGHNLNKNGRGPLGDTTYQISGFSPCGLTQEDFFCLPLNKPM